MSEKTSNDANKDLQAAAQAFHELGIAVIPFKLSEKDNGEYDKKPYVPSWAQWETRPQTDGEFNSLEWTAANALGVILGAQAKNGLYLAVIDHDKKGKDLADEAKAKGEELLKEFPITQTQRTVNRGIHQVYWSRMRPKTEGTFHDVVALELLGEKKVCLMPPSMGYTNLNDNSPTEVENIEDIFYDILRKHGYKLSEETESQNQLDVYGFQLEKLVDLSKLNRLNPNEYQGPHPFHDSTTEKNFHVNIKTNQWYCFRHNSGGGSLQYLAMKEGIIQCEQAKKGALRGAKFKQVLQIAVSQGLIDEKILTQSEINPIILAKDIKEDYVFIVEKDSAILYYYVEKEGIYSDKTEQLLKREIVKRLDENTKAHYYVEVENYITHSSPIVEMNANPELIAVENGVLNVLTRELKPFSPDYYLTQKLPVKYDASAQCPAIMKFLGEVLPEEKQRQIVQEYTGYTLYRKITYHVCLIFVGIGRNGKSKLLELITALLGKDNNVSNQTIQSLCYNRFSVAELHNKLANISADLPSKELTNTGLFRMITGGDRLPAEHKHKDPFNFDNYAKLLFSCNRIPPIPSTEAGLAYYVRFLILEFKQRFMGKEADKRIIDKLTTPDELSGFLNWVLEGLKRLEEQKDFTENMTPEETEKAYVKLSNSAQAFITEMIKVTDEHTDFCFTDVLYRDFITYCHKEKLQTVPKAAFTTTMQEFCNGAEHCKIRPSRDESPLAAWRYIKFVPRVPDVPASQTISLYQKNDTAAKNENILDVFSNRENKVSNSGTNGTDGTESPSTNVEPEEEGLTASHCEKYRTGACPHPNPDCIVPTNPCPKTCGDFKAAEQEPKKDELVKGAVAVLNGDSARREP
jgi:putative DNA primase/helicase